MLAARSGMFELLLTVIHRNLKDLHTLNSKKNLVLMKQSKSQALILLDELSESTMLDQVQEDLEKVDEEVAEEEVAVLVAEVEVVAVDSEEIVEEVEAVVVEDVVVVVTVAVSLRELVLYLLELLLARRLRSSSKRKHTAHRSSKPNALPYSPTSNYLAPNALATFDLKYPAIFKLVPDTYQGSFCLVCMATLYYYCSANTAVKLARGVQRSVCFDCSELN
jgi:hypothetical protein